MYWLSARGTELRPRQFRTPIHPHTESQEAPPNGSQMGGVRLLATPSIFGWRRRERPALSGHRPKAFLGCVVQSVAQAPISLH